MRNKPKIKLNLKILVIIFALVILIYPSFLLVYQNETTLNTNKLHLSSTTELTLINDYTYDYPDTQSEWWGNTEAVMNPSNQMADGFFVSRSAGDYYSNEKFGLLIRFDVYGNVEWFKTTVNSLYPAAMVAALPDERSAMGCYHYNNEYVDFFSYDKNGDSIHNWRYDPTEKVKLVAMKWSNGLWAVGDIEMSTKGIFILKMDYSTGSILVSNTWNLGVETKIVSICPDNSGGLYLTGYLVDNKHQIFIAHSDSSGNIIASKIISSDILNARGVACTYDGNTIYVVSIVQNAPGEDKYHSYIGSFDSNLNLMEDALVTSEEKYGAGYYAKGEDTNWIYYNYDIKIYNSELIVSDVIEKDSANTMIHLFDLSLNEIDYYEYMADSPGNDYHDACGKLVLTEYGKLFSVMFCSLVGSQSPFIRMAEYAHGDIFNDPIYIIGNSGWEWAALNEPWCSGSGIPENPYIIENVLINGNGVGNCIYIEGSDVFFIIRNCVVFNSGSSSRPAPEGGIKLNNVDNGEIRENNCYNNGNGMRLSDCNNIIITDNFVHDNDYWGIDFGWSHPAGSDNIISRNIVTNNFAGISGGTYDYVFENNLISENLVDGNWHYGIIVSGISTNNIITENIITNNGFGGPEYKSIGASGITLAGHNNLVYLNCISENYHNGREHSESNFWDNGAIGNYWSDYYGVDSDGDNIGDTPYYINFYHPQFPDQVPNSRDNFPIWDYTPYLNTPPIAHAGPDLVIDEGEIVIFDASGSSDPDGDQLQYRWDLNNDGSWDTDWSTCPYYEYSWFDDYSSLVLVEVSDGTVSETDTTTVTVNNVAPMVSIDDVVQPFPEFILPSDVIEFHGNFIDPGVLDTHTITWDFGDDTIISDALTPTHAYTEAGVYTVTLTVMDDDGGIGSASFVIMVKSPEEAAEEIIEDVEELDLKGESEASLVLKLEVAQVSIENGLTNVAIKQLNAFIKQVEAMRGKKLTDEEADGLISAAQWLIDNLINNGL